MPALLSSAETTPNSNRGEESAAYQYWLVDAWDDDELIYPAEWEDLIHSGK